MANKPRPVFWIRCRRIARRLRISLVFVCLFLVGILFYLNLVGVPGFVEKSIQQSLQSRGVDVQFSGIKLRFLQGLVAENVQLGDPEELESLSVFCDEIAIGLDWGEFLKFHFTPDALVIGNGFARLPVGREDEIYWLTLDEITAELYFPLEGSWEIRRLGARSQGVDINLSGTLTNSWAVRDWFQFRENDQRDFRLVQEVLGKIEDAQFTSTPTIEINLNGDAADMNNLYGSASMRVEGATGLWGEISNLQIQVMANNRQVSDGLCNFGLEVRASRFRNAIGEIHSFQISGDAQMDLARLSPQQVDLDLIFSDGTFLDFLTGLSEISVRSSKSEDAETGEENYFTQVSADVGDLRFQDIRAAEFQFDSQIHHNLKSLDFADFQSQAELRNLNFSAPKLGEAQVDLVRVSVDVNPFDSLESVSVGEDWHWWRYLAPFKMEGDVALENFNAPGIGIEEIGIGFDWAAPTIKIVNLIGRMDGRELDFRADINVDTRELAASGTLNIDGKKFIHLLTEKTQERLGRLDWTTPPSVELQANLTMPAWTNTAPDWKNEVQPTMTVSGHFESQEAAFRTVPLLSAKSSFTFTNGIWRVPDLVAERPEGTINLDAQFDSRTKHYSVALKGQSFVKPLTPLFGRNGEKVTGSLEETVPASGDLIVYGPWNVGLGGIEGSLTIPGAFKYRGENWEGGSGDFHYTNKFLRIFRGEIFREDGKAESSGISYGETNRLLTISNAISTVDPMVVARMIGTNTASILRHYQFSDPPEIHTSGTLQFEDPKHPVADMRFDVQGGSFQYWKFNLPHVTSRVNWKGDQIELSDISADFYEGRLTGFLNADLKNPKEVPLMFRLIAKDADLEKFMADFGTSTNEVEGTFDLEMGISAPDAGDINTWQGFGQAELRDGLVWNTPVIGVFSPVLNLVKDGLGNVKADRASATFELRESKIFTDDLYVRGPSFGLTYDGVIGLDRTLDAEAQAQIMKETGLFGGLIDFTLSPLTETFKYKVTGTLSEPKATPLYIIPRILLIPIRPFKTLEELAEPISNDGSKDQDQNDSGE